MTQCEVVFTAKIYYNKGYSPGTARIGYLSVKKSCTRLPQNPFFSAGITQDVLFPLAGTTCEMCLPKEVCLSLRACGSQRENCANSCQAPGAYQESLC